MFLSLTLYAPSLPKDCKLFQERRVISENLYLSQQCVYQKESKLDEKDLNTIKKYNWATTKYFTIESRRHIRKICKDLGIKPEWFWFYVYRM